MRFTSSLSVLLSGLLLITAQAAVADLSVVSGTRQTVALNTTSEPIVFELTDATGHPRTGKTLSFTVLDAVGNPTSNATLSPVLANTSSTGLAATQLQPTSISGVYTIQAALDNSTTEIARTTITVASLLPSLGPATAVRADGGAATTKSIFSGGISVKGNPFISIADVSLSDDVIVRGSINVDPSDVGQTVDIIVVAPVTFGTPDVSFFMLGEGTQVLPWNLQIAELVAFQRNVTLAANQIIDIYSNKFLATGGLSVYFGYRKTDGTVVYNGAQTINVTIR